MGGMSELFLGIEDFLVRSPELADSLEALDSNIRVLAIQAAYSPSDGKALFALVFDERRGLLDLPRLAETLGSLHIDCFALDSLSAPEREHFQNVELPRYWIRVEARSLFTAVNELARVATQDELEPRPERGEDWPRGTPVEKQRPRELTSRRDLDDGLSQLYPPLESETPSPGSYSQVRRKPTASLRGPKARRVAPPPPPRGALSVEPAPPALPALRVRFLRGDRWLPARVRYVSNREAKLATAAPLRLGDGAVLGISFARDEMFLSGTVTSVVGIDEPSRSPGFTVAFGKLDKDKKRRLVELLRRARDAGVALKPPPPRRAPRLPVTWPVVINAGGPPRRTIALDVSWSGLYLTAEVPVGEELLFALPLDVAGGAVRGRGRVVRALDAIEAARVQTVPGVGVAITHLGSGDAERYREFLARVERRSVRRVVVAASPSRAQGLAAALAAAGYAVTSSTSTVALAELAGREPRAPDLAVIDDSLGRAAGNDTTLMQLLRSRNVPCVTTRRSERSDSARRVVDRMLAVEPDG